jgi:HEAT repeat protein
LTLAEAAAQADSLAEAGSEQELSRLRAEWSDEIEGAVRNKDYRERAVGYRAIGQFRFKTKTELLRRGLEDESPSVRGSALVALERLSRDAPGVVNSVRGLLHELVNADPNQAVRRLAVVCLRNGSPQRETIVLLEGLSQDDRADRDLQDVAAKVGAQLRKRGNVRQ